MHSTRGGKQLSTKLKFRGKRARGSGRKGGSNEGKSKREPRRILTIGEDMTIWQENSSLKKFASIMSSPQILKFRKNFRLSIGPRKTSTRSHTKARTKASPGKAQSTSSWILSCRIEGVGTYRSDSQNQNFNCTIHRGYLCFLFISLASLDEMEIARSWVSP